MKRIQVLFLCTFLLCACFTPTTYADAAENGVVIAELGNTIIVTYSLPNALENIGGVSLELFYDGSTFKAVQVQAEMISGVEAVAPETDQSGRIGMSWTDSDCALRTEAGQKLAEVRFAVKDGSAETFRLTPRIEIVGGELGMEDFTELSGASSATMYYSFSKQTIEFTNESVEELTSVTSAPTIGIVTQQATEKENVQPEEPIVIPNDVLSSSVKTNVEQETGNVRPLVVLGLLTLLFVLLLVNMLISRKKKHRR